MSTARAKFYIQLDPEVWPNPGLSPFNRLVTATVLFSITVAILESEPLVRDLSPAGFGLLNLIFASIFSVEYMIRLWVMGENDRYRGITGRLRFVVTPASAIDLFATAALWGDVFFQIEGSIAVLLRLVRVLRLMRLARKSHWAAALVLLGQAVAKRRRELVISFGIAGTILLIAATLLFVVEGSEQPDAFGSIPRALWWAVATLTTIGYGDVYPVTALGKICASVVAITSIAIIAMPTGIMAAAFSDAFSGSSQSQEEKGE